MAPKPEKWAKPVAKAKGKQRSVANKNDGKEIQKMRKELMVLKERKEEAEAEERLGTRQSLIYCSIAIVAYLVIVGLVIALQAEEDGMCS